MTEFTPTNADDSLIEEINVLALACLESTATDAQMQRLQQLVCHNAAARQAYIRYMYDSMMLHRRAVGTATRLDRQGESRIAPPLVSDTLAHGFPSSVYRGVIGLSTDWIVAYSIAAVVCGIGIAVAAFTYVSHSVQIAQQSDLLPPPSASIPAQLASPSASVAYVTGMVDCVFEEKGLGMKKGLGIRDWGLEEGSRFKVQGSKEVATSHLVRVGDQIVLASGLLEITYKTGAKVILRGPVEYEVDSADGGFLSLGKLRARVEKRGERRGEGGEGEEGSRFKVQGSKEVASGQWPVASDNQQSSINNHQSSNPQSLIPNPLFAVRTPTATVIDLSTEFGVEVNREGGTQVHVLQGAVEVQSLNTGNGFQTRRLTEGNALQIGSDGGGFKSIAFLGQSFVRQMDPQPSKGSAEEAYIRAVLADRPMGYWPLNESGGSRKFVDRSGNGLVGYAMNKVLAGQPGPFGEGSRAIAVDRTGYIDLGRHDEFAMENDFTVDAWVWADEPEQSGKIFSAYGGPHENPWGWGLGVHFIDQSNPDKWDFSYPMGLELAVFQIKDFRFWTEQESGVPQRQWVHVAAVYDRNNQTSIYLNGQCLGSQQGKGPSLTKPVWLSIGHASSHEFHNWQGRLAHVAVYPYTLSAEQIHNHVLQRKKLDKD